VSRRVRVTEVLRYLGKEHSPVLEALRAEGLFEADDLPVEEAEELRVATVLMEELGVNAAGVQVVLRMRRRLLTLQGLSQEALRRALEDPPRR
jgi:hypothetical protein